MNNKHSYTVTILGFIGSKIVADAIVCTCGAVEASLDSQPYFTGARHMRDKH